MAVVDPRGESLFVIVVIVIVIGFRYLTTIIPDPPAAPELALPGKFPEQQPLPQHHRQIRLPQQPLKLFQT